MEKWMHESLSEILDFPVPQDMTQYIMQMQNEHDLDNCLQSLLNYSNPKHRQFVAELKRRQAQYNDHSGYKKPNHQDIPKEKKKGKMKAKENVQPQEPVKLEKIEKKKTKFVNLYSQDGHDTILLKGRHKCNCEAKSHTLVNNCINCGRIVCMQEGPGPCFFCGELVCSPEQQAILASNSKKANVLYNKLKSQKPSKSFEDSIKQRDKLLEYDRNGVRCTKVIDDESDYYQTNSVWLSTMEREKLQKMEEEMNERKHGSRLNRKITFDFTGREVVQEEDPTEEYSEQQFQELCESIPFDDFEQSNVCPTIEFDRPTYIEGDDSKPRTPRTRAPSSITNRVQDKDYLDICDQGVCLSMHQPYASLLTAGIKTHEGRTWYSAHRGRLWIASASKVPTTEDISNMQQFYRVLKDEKIIFPEHYSTGCLLGCVTVVDVLPQEEYRKLYPEGESDSPYVFICENCYTLPIKFPMQGKHKIYKLDPKIHQAAVKSLEKVMKGKSS